MDAYLEWQARERVLELRMPVRAGFALACARLQATLTDPALAAALEAGWEALSGDRDDVVQIVKQLGQRQDLDDDHVAATYYALSAVQGDGEAAWWSASRALDAAFAAVDDQEEFRPLAEDAQRETVLAELGRQEELLRIAEEMEEQQAIAALRR